MEKNCGYIPKQVFEQTVIYYGKTMVLRKKYGTMEKNMVLWTKLWYTKNGKYTTLINYGKTMLLWEKLWYYNNVYSIFGWHVLLIRSREDLHPINKELIRNHYCFLPHSFSLLELGVKDQNIKR